MGFFSVIVEAVVLLTGKMDRNLVYREALKNTTGDDVISTDTIVAIISITVPVVVGNVFQKILVIYFLSSIFLNCDQS